MTAPMYALGAVKLTRTIGCRILAEFDGEAAAIRRAFCIRAARHEACHG
jgi:hypothetical protein